MEVLKDIVSAMPKIPMGQTSKNDSGKVELSDVEKAIARGKAITDCAN